MSRDPMVRHARRYGVKRLTSTGQYEIVQDGSKRESYGTLVSLSAKKGTEFYHRMAAWPVAFEEAVKEIARRHLPQGDFSRKIYAKDVTPECLDRGSRSALTWIPYPSIRE